MNVELYPEPKRVGQQLKYADRKGFRIAIVAGANEFETGTVQIKHLASQSNSIVDWHGDMHILTDAVHSALQADQHGHHL
jgi:histidyl-tRNA synthetase